MLKKKYRLVLKKDWINVKENGVMVGNPLFGILWMKAEEFKLGMVVSKKISKKAVDRNRIRRLISRVVDLNRPKKKWWIVILVKQAIKKKSLEVIEDQWKKILNQMETDD